MEAVTKPTQPYIKPSWLVAIEGASSQTIAIAAFLMGVAVVLAYRPWSQIELGDPAVYDYIAQSILRGQLPYRDVVDIKGPGGAYLSAAAMFVGKFFGLRDVIAVRLLNVILVGVLSAVTYLVAEAYLKDRVAALLAFLIPLMPEHFFTTLIAGTQPKLPMILFGMISLLLIARDKPLGAGFFSMLSCLCWQPGLLFTGTAFLIFSRYLTSWRDRRVLKVVAGALIPLLIVLLYFKWKGAIGDLWAWTITYNFSVFGPEAKGAVGDAAEKLWTVFRRVFRLDPAGVVDTFSGQLRYRFESFAGLVTLAMVPASLIGLVIFGVDRVRTKMHRSNAGESPGLFADALFIAPAVYLAFCLINFQAGADLIPFFPFIGILGAVFFVKAGAYLGSRSWVKHVGWARLIPVTVLAGIIAIILIRAVTYRPESFTLRDQDTEFKAISDLLTPDDKIYVHGRVEILVLLNRPNLNPYVIMDWDADNFAAARKVGGWNGIMEEMEAEAPKVVAISRLRAVAHRNDIVRWVEEHYDPVALPRYDRVYVRKQ